MERAATDLAGVVGLSSLLAAIAAPAGAADADARPVAPDPEVERRATLEAARAEGFAAGMRDADAAVAERVARAEAGLRDAHAKQQAALAAERDRLVALVAALPSALADLEEDTAALAAEVACLAVSRLISAQWADGAMLLELCRGAVVEHRLRDATLRLAPGDAGLLREQPAGIAVVADDAVPPGGCWIESPRGRVRTGLDVRLAELVRALLASIERGATP